MPNQIHRQESSHPRVSRTLTVIVVLLFSVVILLLPAAEVQAGCFDAAGKTFTTTLLSAAVFILADCLLTLCMLTLSTSPITIPVLILTTLYSCFDAMLWQESPQHAH